MHPARLGPTGTKNKLKINELLKSMRGIMIQIDLNLPKSVPIWEDEGRGGEK